jgi:hypothetical protein
MSLGDEAMIPPPGNRLGRHVELPGQFLDGEHPVVARPGDPVAGGQTVSRIIQKEPHERTRSRGTHMNLQCRQSMPVKRVSKFWGQAKTCRPAASKIDA